jgi:hypothetical protein
LSADYLSVPDDQIPRIESLLTVTGGNVVYAALYWGCLWSGDTSNVRGWRAL